MGYDHRRHAGNAGDVWKHLLLAEVADRLLAAGVRVYVESHAGRPGYLLRPGGEWEGGVGRLWPVRDELAASPYFQIVAGLNPHRLERYPGSAAIVLELARRHGFALRAELWDTSPEVEEAWRSVEKGRSLKINFHIGDGFSGASKLTRDLDEAALLLVDSPYVERGDASLVRELISRSAAAGWVVLSWQVLGPEAGARPACNHREFALRFEEAGLVCGPMKGAAMVLAWDEGGFLDQKIDDLIEELGRIEIDLPKVAGRMSESF
ncbi:MAG: 23S rRNA (adenine(2030)-N(6))-methyltransferase RlmJ [Methanothrix sp.]|jgi:23S rRNA (adenine2030-N6)-methyltransferase|nr:23S rRNA (adenine(2030)-N(6))-methyltransferase RlmJ [Methanothrix sp.]